MNTTTQATLRASLTAIDAEIAALTEAKAKLLGVLGEPAAEVGAHAPPGPTEAPVGKPQAAPETSRKPGAGLLNVVRCLSRGPLRIVEIEQLADESYANVKYHLKRRPDLFRRTGPNPRDPWELTAEGWKLGSADTA